ncbi:MAG: AmmeMemoRadiSam system protein A [Firmicutes bacterium]|nr:AmmeMemoRadiSam system protein A [Bacillota bacterium]
MKEKRDKYVELARLTINDFVIDRRKRTPDYPLDKGFVRQAAVFVSLKKDGQLRGCIGTIEPCYENIAQEIINNAISACSQDPRFNPVVEEELPRLDITVDVLSKPEKVNKSSELDPDKYGVIVENGVRKGVLLPALPGISDYSQQLEIARKKAGILPDEEIEIYRFKVNRYK